LVLLMSTLSLSPHNRFGEGAKSDSRFAKWGVGGGVDAPAACVQRRKGWQSASSSRRNCLIYDNRRDRNASKFWHYFNGSSSELGRDWLFLPQCQFTLRAIPPRCHSGATPSRCPLAAPFSLRSSAARGPG